MAEGVNRPSQEGPHPGPRALGVEAGLQVALLGGVAAGLLAYHALAPGLAITDTLGPLSEGGLRLAASGALSVALTAGAMVRLRAVHGPACATTLIVALGVLPGLREAVVIVAAVAGMYGAHVASRSRRARG